MSEDASLDDFLGGDEDGGDDGAVEGDDAPEAAAERDGEGEAAASRSDPAAGSGVDVPPATTTYAWDPEGAPCDACGAVVERRWRQDGAVVCVECKTWSG